MESLGFYDDFRIGLCVVQNYYFIRILFWFFYMRDLVN